jgi:hypothetical protein
MRLSRTDLLPVLTIVAGGVLGASLSFSFLGSRSYEVRTVTLGPAASFVLQIPNGTATGFARLAPYEGIVWPESTPGQPQVLLGSDWFQLTSVDGMGVAEIIAHARAAYGSIWQKRFDEDLVEVLGGMGSPPGEIVLLGLRDLETGEALMRIATMSSDSRDALHRAKYSSVGSPSR